MFVRKVIEKEVNSCAQCPYFHTEQDMNATLCGCELKGKGYDSLLSDIGPYNCHSKISKYCPLSLDN